MAAKLSICSEARKQILCERPRFIVVQMGARHNYAVPAAFEQLGLLEALYTDLCGTRRLGRVAANLARFPVPMRARLAALGARIPPPEVALKTRTFDWIGLQLDFARWAGQGSFDAYASPRYRTLAHALGQSMIRAGYGGATHIYSMLGESGAYVVEAKRRGLRVICDVYIALSADNIVRAETCAFPDWSGEPPGSLSPQPVRPPNEVMLTTSDTFVCPSEFVRDDLVAAAGVPREKTIIVPYIVGESWLAIDNRPEPGRVLFAGTADLRKGIHYLAMAADRLRTRQRRYRFIIAGHATPEVRGQPICRNLEFLGRVLRTQIRQEFAEADIFVLPSLAEGSAGVTYEALGAGVPVVTTPSAGSVVRDGIDGLIVPERDPDALARAIESIVDDRPRRTRMAAAARERAREFTADRFANRFIKELCLPVHSVLSRRTDVQRFEIGPK
jgi:glycosyltransferase involved in cell wall biosynthesis